MANPTDSTGHRATHLINYRERGQKQADNAPSRHKGRGVAATETSCFLKLKKTIKNFFTSTKRLFERVIKVIVNFLSSTGTKINDSLEEGWEKVKNIKTPFRKNYVDVNILGHRAQIGKDRTVGDFFNK